MVRTQQSIDRRPGRLPDIRTDDGGITFVMVPRGAPNPDQLVIRCDDNDEAWVSIRPRRTGGIVASTLGGVIPFKRTSEQVESGHVWSEAGAADFGEAVTSGVSRGVPA
jgi:hypothetical protein